jgi:hypothetical protein
MFSAPDGVNAKVVGVKVEGRKESPKVFLMRGKLPGEALTLLRRNEIDFSFLFSPM